MTEKLTGTGQFKALQERFGRTWVIERVTPALRWMPRLVREHLTLHNAIAATVALFSAGVLWNDHLVKERLKVLDVIKASQDHQQLQIDALQNSASKLEGKFDGFIAGAGRIIDETPIPHGPPPRLTAGKGKREQKRQ